MEDTISTLFYSLANPCFRKDSLIIGELKENMYILFRNRIWSMLIYVNEVFSGSASSHAHLLVEIGKSEGCAVLSCPQGLYLHGVDKQDKDGKAFLYHTPFLRVGQGMSISENVEGDLSGGKSLFYELREMFAIDFSSLC